MADDSELLLYLEDLERGRYARVKVTYKNHENAGIETHRVGWSRLADDWLARSFENRLELTWRSTPREILSDPNNPFPVDQIGLPSKRTGEFKLKWKVWTKSQDITDHNQVELYSVMRAEERYISKGYTKLASKYYCDTHGGPSENFGVDSFFKKDGGPYVVCESKFTRKEDVFNEWKGKKKRERERWIWTYKLKKYKGVIPMSWEWIEDRARRAVKDAPVEIVDRTAEQNARVRAEVKEMAKAVRKPRNVIRKVNFYGAKEVPIYPGRYRFMCAEGKTRSKNLLHLRWTFKIDQKEFITLDERFDEWVEERT